MCVCVCVCVDRACLLAHSVCYHPKQLCIKMFVHALFNVIPINAHVSVMSQRSERVHLIWSVLQFCTSPEDSEHLWTPHTHRQWAAKRVHEQPRYTILSTLACNFLLLLLVTVMPDSHSVQLRCHRKLNGQIQFTYPTRRRTKHNYYFVLFCSMYSFLVSVLCSFDWQSYWNFHIIRLLASKRAKHTEWSSIGSPFCCWAALGVSTHLHMASMVKNAMEPTIEDLDSVRFLVSALAGCLANVWEGARANARVHSHAGKQLCARPFSIQKQWRRFVYGRQMNRGIVCILYTMFYICMYGENTVKHTPMFTKWISIYSVVVCCWFFFFIPCVYSLFSCALVFYTNLSKQILLRMGTILFVFNAPRSRGQKWDEKKPAKTIGHVYSFYF